MEFIDKFLKRWGYEKNAVKPPSKRGYDAAKIDRLSNSFLTPVTTGDVELLNSLWILRARSREAERNNDYAKKFLNMCRQNIIGKTGFTLQNKSRDPGGKMDKMANDIIEGEWTQWGKKGNCTVDGQLSWLAEQELFIKTVARDGEFLGRKVRGFKNPWKFAIQNLEADLLNENHNISDGSGQNLIKMGIEYDKWNRPVAYHLRKRHPGDYFRAAATSSYERVPASEIIHCFIMDRSTQGRGVPWMHTALRRLNQVSEYEYAEVVAARIGASKMGFYEKNAPETMDEIIGDDQDEQETPIMEAEPGIFEKLPAGFKFSPFLPDHPTTQYANFIKASLRGSACGLNVSYNSFANDLEGVNFSSMRAGAIEERDAWKQMQQWVISDFITQIFESWLEMLLLTNRTFLPYSKYDKFNAPVWRGRIFDWVDPSKDIDGELKVARAKWKSDRQIVAERFNMELEDLYEEIAADEELKKKYGIEADLSQIISKRPPVEDVSLEGGANE